MRIALCNEVIAKLPFEQQCAFAAELGYDGLELAPFTLDAAPHLIGAAEQRRLRGVVEAAGLKVTGLHWLLVTPKGLSITAADANVRTRTVEVMRRLVELCAALGGQVLVHGSPAQRQVETGDDRAAALGRAEECWARAAEAAAAADVVYCIEPLSPDQTPIVNTLAEAAEIVRRIGSPALRTMIDTSSAAWAEEAPVTALIDRWLPTGLVAHIQVNDRNRRGPGQGSDRFAPVFAALSRHRYRGVVAVEPFDYKPDGLAAAARAIGYVRGLLEAGEGST